MPKASIKIYCVQVKKTTSFRDRERRQMEAGRKGLSYK